VFFARFQPPSQKFAPKLKLVGFAKLSFATLYEMLFQCNFLFVAKKGQKFNFLKINSHKEGLLSN
jgi:hypothetical protein